MKTRLFQLAHKPLTLFLILVLLGGALQACAPQTPVPPDKLKVVILPYTSFGPIFIAQEEGYFAEQNLEVEFIRFESGTSPLPALATGEVDVLGTGPSVGLFNAIAGGSEVKLVADKGYLASDGCTYMSLLATKTWMDKNPAPNADSFKGARVSIDPTNFEAFMFEQVLKEHGLTLDDVNPQDIAPPALAEAAANDAVDIISVGDPWITRLTGSGEVAIWKPYQEIVPDMQFGFIAFAPTLFRDKPEVGARFLAAYLKGIEKYNEGKTDRNLEIMAKYTQLDVEILQKACWPPMNVTGQANLETVDAFQAWALERGLLDATVAADKYWDGSFLEQAKKFMK
jgi:NitT/TauT family transport system substrate-binding protein